MAKMKESFPTLLSRRHAASVTKRPGSQGPKEPKGRNLVLPKTPPKEAPGTEIEAGRPPRETAGREMLFEHSGPFLVTIPPPSDEVGSMGARVMTPQLPFLKPYVQFGLPGKEGIVNVYVHDLPDPKAAIGTSFFGSLQLWQKFLVDTKNGEKKTFFYIDFHFLGPATGKAPYSWRVSPASYVGSEMSGMKSFRRFQCPPPVVAMIVIGESADG